MVNWYDHYPARDRTKKIVKEERYIEASLLIHMAILDELINLIIHETYRKDEKPQIKNSEFFYPIKEKTWGGMDYKMASTVCLFMDIISDLEFKRLMSFNSLRNKLAHSLSRKNIKLKEILEGIEDAEKLLDKLFSLQLKYH